MKLVEFKSERNPNESRFEIRKFPYTFAQDQFAIYDRDADRFIETRQLRFDRKEDGERFLQVAEL